ncbi:hypothetical protein [Shewanella baltica]|uniref:Uncharacterized protein n=1 Tax=Shewanella baltica (strain OS155 / ATCC BAA-1091) TaxID=325240 RepID=A3D8P2_SHEB5|nr:hypothetical protein [Shewanella baltica]ABN63105.1 hypothetical protein Sbal_3630 [Shewanella baltica OS155]
MEVVTLIISGVSLIVASAALYFSQLRKAKVEAIVGPQLTVYHHDYEVGVSTGFIIPTSFLNDSPSTGNIIRTAISIQKSDDSEEAYYMQWLKFAYLDEKKNSWLFECDAHPLVVTPRTGVHKNIFFMWLADNSRKLNFDKGKYKITMYVWNNESKKPSKFIKEFLFTAENQALLESKKTNKDKFSINIQIDKQLEVNRLLSKNELEKLL